MSIRVWDLPVRFFHWSLMLSILLLYASAKSGLQDMHVWVGYFLVALLFFRVLWGFFGSRHARFTDFVKTPKEVLGYIKAVFAGASERFLGHNPAGGAMVIALLLVLGGLVGTGLVLDAGIEFEGPLMGVVSTLRDSEVYWVRSLHAWLVDALWIMVALHLVGVVHASAHHEENLVKSMLTGTKPVQESR